MTSVGDRTDTRRGLTAAEVARRRAEGAVNRVPPGPQRTLAQIVRANVLTPVNAIMLTLFALILVSGNPQDGLFVGVVVSNSVVGIVQEARARRELARLQVLAEPTATVVRDGEAEEVGVDAIVRDDLLEVANGQQVVVDGEVAESRGLEIDESLLTGESDPVPKEPGDPVRSGSFVVAGTGAYVATAIGDESYAVRLAAEARRFSLGRSDLRRGVDRVLRWMTAVIPVVAALVLWSLLGAQDRWQDALQGTVAAAVAMVPDGLVLLTSIAFMAGVVALARHQALAQQLSTVEVLARVDVLCMDKTGTITTGNMGLTAVEALGDRSEDSVREVLAALVATDASPNATLAAVAKGVGPDPGWEPDEVEPFSSSRKWAGATFGDDTWVLGAPDVVLDPGDRALGRVHEEAGAGRRVLVLAHGRGGVRGGDLPAELEACALLVLEDVIRPEAPDTIRYFRAQGVDLKVISGDDPQTVAAIATRAGVDGAEAACDARTLSDDGDDIGRALEENVVIGRVSPHQKQAMVAALQARGHVVAMTGDGVNDVLALKDADIGVAMGSGSSASRAVADLVLTDSSFASLPVVVDEGRKVINNVERVANLFLSKSVYAVLLAVVVAAAGIPFPFLPRQLTLIGTFSIGLPGFFLALAPEVTRIRPGFLSRVLRFSVPAGLVAGTATLVVYEVARRSGSVSLAESRTASTMTLLGIGLAILLVTSRPLRPWKVALVAGMAALYSLIFGIGPLRDFFDLELFAAWMWAVVVTAVAAAGAVCLALPRLVPGLAGWEERDDASRPEGTDLLDGDAPASAPPPAASTTREG